jgi:hypothetical protein
LLRKPGTWKCQEQTLKLAVAVLAVLVDGFRERTLGYYDLKRMPLLRKPGTWKCQKQTLKLAVAVAVSVLAVLVVGFLERMLEYYDLKQTTQKYCYFSRPVSEDPEKAPVFAE